MKPNIRRIHKQQVFVMNHKLYKFSDNDWNIVHGACERFARDELETTKEQRYRRNQWNLEKMLMAKQATA